ncbi:MAG TPA: response regulator transcription factor [Verrucomicrobiae bacterium]|nr:response regulator transcription factor [Verrucomicrobiae bacterium]
MTISVSIVEDDAPAREILADWMRHSDGFKCVGQHASVEQALERLANEKPSVVLMDINLPGLSGIEGVRRLKPLLPNTQFLMLTVYEDTDHVFDALAAGATGYLLKQTPRGELLASIRDVFAGGSPMTSNIARRVVQAFYREEATTPSSAKLSTREREVLELLARGYLYKEIMDMLNVSRGTLNTYVRRVYEKLHVRSRAQAVAKFSHFSLNHPNNHTPKS